MLLLGQLLSYIEKCSLFLKLVRILPEIDWYHYQGARPLRGEVSHQSPVCPPPMLPPECISSLFISISLLIVKSEYELQELSKLNNTSSFIINLVSSIRYIMSPPFCLTSLIMSFTWLSVGFCPIDLSTAVSS